MMTDTGKRGSLATLTLQCVCRPPRPGGRAGPGGSRRSGCLCELGPEAGKTAEADSLSGLPLWARLGAAPGRDPGRGVLVGAQQGRGRGPPLQNKESPRCGELVGRRAMAWKDPEFGA